MRESNMLIQTFSFYQISPCGQLWAKVHFLSLIRAFKDIIIMTYLVIHIFGVHLRWPYLPQIFQALKPLQYHILEI